MKMCGRSLPTQLWSTWLIGTELTLFSLSTGGILRCTGPHGSDLFGFFRNEKAAGEAARSTRLMASRNLRVGGELEGYVAGSAFAYVGDGVGWTCFRPADVPGFGLHDLAGLSIGVVGFQFKICDSYG